MDIWITTLLLAITGLTASVESVEVHFETPDSGFFLKHSPRQTAANSDVATAQIKSKADHDSILSVDKFTIVQTAQPVSIRASYGPFSTKQTVPARYIVPDIMEAASDAIQNTTVALLDMQQTNLHLDISAHLVQSSIPRDSPVLRVLFHAGADPGGHLQRQKICVLLHVALGSHSRTPLKGRCMPEGEDGVCVAEVIIPSNWWPPLPAPEKDGRSSAPHKTPQRMVQVSYSVFEPPARSPEQCEPKVQIQPLTPFARIPLTQAMTAYKELRADDLLTLLVPNQPLYPLSKIHVPVFLQQQPDQNIAVFIVRARVKAGMKILGATASSDEWNVSVEKENSKHTVARVTAFRKDRDPDSTTKDDESGNSNRIIEVFSWLLEVANDTKEHWDGGRIVWSVSYVHDGPKMKQPAASIEHDEHRRKLVAKVEIQKDEIQKVLPISKNWEVMNTAVLTGRQVSQAMKVFIVSQAGKVADVTLQSSCTVEDESVIKVSSSCSSVYVDGSEARGSSNASVVVKYGTYVGLARFTVWMPEFPLEVSVADFRLSQIKGWRIPDDTSIHGKSHRKKRAYGWAQTGDDFSNGLNGERNCRARYQQSPVEIFAKFLAVDQDSGRVSYLISRRTALRVTDLIQPLLRVADPKIATLKGRILQGRAMGRTDVQVLSPITGRVIGAKEIRVGSDKVSITKLLVRVVSGLQLSIATDNAIENGYIAETSVTRRLTAQYQEGLLDIDLEFTDGSRTPLRDIAVDDYFLLVESLDTDVVAFAPMLASHHPRVIAVGEGNGDLLRVTLLLSEECRLRRNIPVSKQGPKATAGPLASALASVQVDFSTTDSPNTRPDTVQNDGFSGARKGGNTGMGDLTDILIGIPLKDDTNHEPTVQARQHRGGVAGISHIGVVGLGNNKSLMHHDMTSMEIGMYVLLTAFCLAIAVFVVSCVVYASKFRPVVTIDQLVSPTKDRYVGPLGHLSREPRNIKESTTNAHDWVWLGRASIERSSVAHDAASNANQRDSRIRITSNPIMSYSVQDETAVNNGFENPQHQMPMSKSAGHVIDTSTYNKNDKRLREPMDTAPPLPPHGLPVIARSRNVDYRPPVPPHRNVGVTANLLNDNDGVHKRSLPEITDIANKKQHHHRVHRNGNIPIRRSCGNDIQIHNPPSQEAHNSTQRNLNLTQQQIHAALFNVSASSVPQYTVQPISNEILNRRSIKSPSSPSSSITGTNNNEYELHMAERLVENAVQQQKTAFKFDTITPKKPLENNETSGAHCMENTPEVKMRRVELTAPTKNQTLESSSDDNGGFITPPPDENRSESQVKRATVLSNPMFSSSPVSDLGPGETLGLDDLDMDYEQIMHYFDNLKESNA